MKTPLFASITATLCIGLAACVPAEDPNEPDVTRFRAAIPTMNQLAAPNPEASTQASNIVGETALYPQAAFPIVVGVNSTVALTVGLMKAVTSLPPTFFNSETKEYVWGPFPNNDGPGYIAVYVKDTEGAGDFRYEYGFLRGIGNDLATLTPVILGGATPDENDDTRGQGVIVWDFEADNAFEELHNPDYDPATQNHGRFAAAYFKGEADDGTNNEVLMVVAVLRNFIGENDAGAEEADLDYFYGNVENSEHRVDFLDFAFQMDVDDPADGINEDVGIRMAFLDEGTGRAEADVVGGSLADNARGDVVECWDSSLTETFIHYEVSDNGAVTEMASEGQLSDCGLFAATLDELTIPSLEDVDGGIMSALDQVAENGVGE